MDAAKSFESAGTLAGAPILADRHAGIKTVAASAFGLAVGPSCMTILAFGAFISPLDREFHWGVPAISFAASIISIMMMIVSPVQGVLVDRFGGRRIVLWSIPPFALGLAALYVLPANLTLFYLAWIAIPVLGMGLWPVSYLRTTAGWFDTKLGLALGAANAGIGVGSMLVPLLCAYMIAHYGWRDAYLCLGVAAFAAWPVAFFFLRDPLPAASGVPITGETFLQAAETRPFWIMLAAFFFLGLFTTGLIVHQVRIFIDSGIPPGIATAIPAAFGAALIVARLGTGWLLDRIAASWIMLVLMCGGAVAALLLASGPDVPRAIVCAILIGTIAGAEFDVLSYIIPRYHGRRAFGKIYGIIFAVFNLSSAIGAFAVGASRGSLKSYTPAMLTMVAICLLTAVLFAGIGPYRYRAGERL